MDNEISIWNRRMRTAKEENEIIKIALSQVNINIFVYDRVSKKIEFIDNNVHPFGRTKVISDIESILEIKIIDPEYICQFKELFKKIDQGEKAVSATIMIKFLSQWTWQNIMLISYSDSINNTTQIIGTIQDVSNRVESEQRYYSEQRFRQTMLVNHRVYEVNLTRNRFMKLESIQDTTDCGRWSTYTESLENLRTNFVLPEYWEYFSKVSNKENLLEGFKNGQTEFYCEYRVRNESGDIFWSASKTHLLKDPISGDIKGFIYVQDIDAKKKQELYLQEQAEKDPLTGIYNRIAAQKLIDNILVDSDCRKIYGFLTLDVDNFKQINDNFGHITGDFLLQQIANSFKRIVRRNDIFARIGGDEFIVFINGVNNIKDIIDIAERLCLYVRNISINDEKNIHTSLSIGIATYPTDGLNFAELYKNSDTALYSVKNEGKDDVRMFSSRSSNE